MPKKRAAAAKPTIAKPKTGARKKPAPDAAPTKTKKPAAAAAAAPAPRKNQKKPAAKAAEAERTCRRCHQSFLPSQNSAAACRYHPEIFSGETKQRWMESGESLEKARKDGSLGEIHYFWTCCGSGDKKATGCRATRHSTYDDPPDTLTYC
jgi:hypothetical protein